MFLISFFVRINSGESRLEEKGEVMVNEGTFRSSKIPLGHLPKI